MKERPIIFSAPMVQAILDGKKTQTRRVIKPQPESKIDALGKARDAVLRSGGNVYFCDHSDTSAHDTPYVLATCPYGQPGDRLWVRETWCFREDPYNEDGEHDNTCVHYRADGYEVIALDDDGFRKWNKDRSEASPWRPSIYMPRWASRITLEITKVRVERLNDISESDARAEGITDGGCWNCGESEPCGCADPLPMPCDSFARLWQQLHGDASWFSNPWVWVIEFEAVKK